DEMKLFYALDPRLTKQILGAFIVARDQDFYDAASDYSSRVWRIRSVDGPAARMIAAGHEDVYGYRFDWDEGGSFLFMDLGKVLGAGHGVEIPFVFNRFEFFGDADRIMFAKKTRDSREKLSRAMGAYWAEFARTGAPGDAGSPKWTRYGADGDAALMRFDSEQDGGVEMMPGADSFDRLIADLKADPRVDAEERCQIVSGIVDWVPSLEGLLSPEFGCK
ncbi:MAG: carboxylesterase family protein, partial [Pseudomonadota bacterium]